MNEIIVWARNTMGSELSNASILTLVKSGQSLLIRYKRDNHGYLEGANTMKEILKTEVLHVIQGRKPVQKMLWKFLCYMDDNNSHSVETKLYFMKRFLDICHDVDRTITEENKLKYICFMLGNF